MAAIEQWDTLLSFARFRTKIVSVLVNEFNTWI